jgi:uncharacterized protein YbjT (DUF2867 family)
MKVAVTGATGFVGRNVVNELLRRGHAVTVSSRNPDQVRSRFNWPVRAVAGDILDPKSLESAFAGSDAVIHLVGIINESGGHSFDEIHRQGTENGVVAARRAGALRYVHMSAMGSSPASPSEYGRTKAAAEEAVRRSKLAWTIFRPSVMFGRGDGFASLLAGVIRANPGFIPVIGPGTTRFMPVSVLEAARMFAGAPEKPESEGKSFEIGGPEILDMNSICREIAAALGKTGKPLVHLPIWWGRILALAFERLPAPPLTRDQIRSLAVDNVGDIAPTSAIFGPPAIPFRTGIREYIRPRSRRDPTIGI